MLREAAVRPRPSSGGRPPLVRLGCDRRRDDWAGRPRVGAVYGSVGEAGVGRRGSPGLTIPVS